MDQWCKLPSTTKRSDRTKFIRNALEEISRNMVEYTNDEWEMGLQFNRIGELVKEGYTSGREADFTWELFIRQL